MAEKAFLQIKETEAKANALVINAGEEAALIIKCAEEAAADMLLQSTEKYRQQAEEKKRQAETAAHTNSMNFSEETEVLCETLKQKLSLRKQNAVDAVIQIITT